LSKPVTKPAKASKTTGLTPEEEAEQVENAQIRALQKRDEQIVRLRESNRELHATIDKLNADVVRLRQVIRVLLVRLGFDASELPTDPEIAEAVKA
jgi:hypothetical protein